MVLYGNPLQYSSHEQSSRADYSPSGRKELDTTEWLTYFLLARHFAEIL